jgi:hypothetical protein
LFLSLEGEEESIIILERRDHFIIIVIMDQSTDVLEEKGAYVSTR